MIQVGARSKIYVVIDPVDFRAGFSKLSQAAKQILKEDPFSGHIFIFKNRSSTAVKMICFDGRVCWSIHAKFAQGKLTWWPQIKNINSAQLMGLLSQSSKVEVEDPFRDVS